MRVPIRVRLAQSKAGHTMTNPSAIALFMAVGGMSALASAEDVSRYREFQLGMDLATVAKQAGTNPSEAKVIHSRPALIQEFEWRPQVLGGSSKTEPAHHVALQFYNGELFRIVVSYDRNETEGLTPDDIAGSISATYGVPAEPPASIKIVEGRYGDQEEILARWQDAQYRFDLIRSSYGPSFSLVGVLKRLETPVQAAILEAKRLDDLEAPQREAVRIASEEEAGRAKLEKARLVNKPNFRP